MQYARIEIDKQCFDAREKSVALETIFGTVYAPKSKIIVVRERKPDMATNIMVEMLVPVWVFRAKDLNPCQMTTGFIEQIRI